MLMEKIEIFRKFMKKAKISLQIRIFGPEPALIEIDMHGLAYGLVRESRLGIAKVEYPPGGQISPLRLDNVGPSVEMTRGGRRDVKRREGARGQGSEVTRHRTQDQRQKRILDTGGS